MYSPVPEHQYLTYDEQIAAEAAFKGRPLNPNWTENARKIYVDIRKVLEKGVSNAGY